jgi:hypothetical protein
MLNVRKAEVDNVNVLEIGQYASGTTYSQASIDNIAIVTRNTIRLEPLSLFYS